MTDSVNKHWAIIQDILSREGIARQHLTSFDEFLTKGLQEIINEIDHIDIENAEYPYRIKLGRIQFKQPRMMELDGSVTHITPAEARLRNVSYVAPLMLEASVIEDGKVKFDIENQVIKSCLVTHKGEIIHETTKNIIEGESN